MAAGNSPFPLVGIVLLNWNQPEVTIACLASLAELDYPAYTTVVVDNGSTDSSPALIRLRYPDIALIENGYNAGFARGNNIGISHLLDLAAEYVLLLNNDTEVAPDLLTVLMKVAAQSPSVGILGPKIYYYSPSHIIWSAGGSVDPRGEPCHLKADQPDDGVEGGIQRVDYVSGCAMLVSREVIDSIGVLDERFFIYFEETEWCARARRAGFGVAYVPQARVWHKIGQSTRAQSPRYLYLMARNRLLYLRCSGAGSWTIFQAAMDLLRGAASSLRRGRDRESLACSRAVLRGVGHFAIGRFGAPPAGL